MNDHAQMAEQFERFRPHLGRVAYRMLGSHTEAEDAVQETWIRLSRSSDGGREVENLSAWLTTVISRICLNVLRSRAGRPEDPIGVHLPDPVVGPEPSPGPEDEVLLNDLISLALLVVLDTLTPAERVAFVLHDMFYLTFDEIAAVIGRTPAATRQLASRARRRVQGAQVTDSASDVVTQRALVNAFLAAARNGDLDGLVAVLDPDVELHADGGLGLASATALIRGSRRVAERAAMFRQPGATVTAVLVNGAPGALVHRDDTLISVMGFAFRNGRISHIQILLDPERL